jgi:hypothetical protein
MIIRKADRDTEAGVLLPEDFGADVAPSMHELDARLRDRESS